VRWFSLKPVRLRKVQSQLAGESGSQDSTKAAHHLTLSKVEPAPENNDNEKCFIVESLNDEGVFLFHRRDLGGFDLAGRQGVRAFQFPAANDMSDTSALLGAPIQLGCWPRALKKTI
jgi:hypothetical protein